MRRSAGGLSHVRTRIRRCSCHPFPSLAHVLAGIISRLVHSGKVLVKRRRDGFTDAGEGIAKFALLDDERGREVENGGPYEGVHTVVEHGGAELRCARGGRALEQLHVLPVGPPKVHSAKHTEGATVLDGWVFLYELADFLLEHWSDLGDFAEQIDVKRVLDALVRAGHGHRVRVISGTPPRRRRVEELDAGDRADGGHWRKIRARGSSMQNGTKTKVRRCEASRKIERAKEQKNKRKEGRQEGRKEGMERRTSLMCWRTPTIASGR